MSVKILFKQFFCIVAMSLLTLSYTYAEAMVRVKCTASISDAVVFINGKPHGNCPLSVVVDPGDITVRVVQTVDSGLERVYERKFTLAGNAIKSLRVKLSSPQLSEKAKKTRAEEALKNARAGNIQAMKQLSEFYSQGLGLEKNTEKSAYWSKQAVDKENENTAQGVLKRAESGDVDAMAEMVKLYQQGKGVKKSEAEAKRWQKKREQTIAAKDKKEADRVLGLAKGGNIAAMEKVAEFYTSGTGVEKNAAKAKEWHDKAKQNKDAQAQEKVNEKRKAELDQQLVDYKSGKVYFSNFIKSGKLVGMDAKAGDTGAASSIITFSPTVLAVTAVGLVSDLITSPFHATKQIQLQNELNARAAVWQKPNSMVAKAYAQQQTQQ